MKATGIVRKVDELGRIVIPVELRRTLGISEHDPLEVFVDGGRIVLKKHEAQCVFCGATGELLEYRDKKVCASCAEALSDAVGRRGQD
ncbi:MAG: AbrB/MazE/SpoVT family DNA-binding domain-containing protein [Hydrogenibacillus sp.]|nr:AbrB/MazE/SpoVT family DNA-binding domain-containing protein [Hydrogenibacillus sp.]